MDGPRRGPSIRSRPGGGWTEKSETPKPFRSVYPPRTPANISPTGERSLWPAPPGPAWPDRGDGWALRRRLRPQFLSCHGHHYLKTHCGYRLCGDPGSWEWEAPASDETRSSPPERCPLADNRHSFNDGVAKKISRELVSASPSALCTGVTSISGIDASCVNSLMAAGYPDVLPPSTLSPRLR